MKRIIRAIGAALASVASPSQPSQQEPSEEVIFEAKGLSVGFELLQAIETAREANGGFSEREEACIYMFLQGNHILEESLAIADKTKDEITRQSRLELARVKLLELEELSKNPDCILKIGNADEQWADYYRLSGSLGYREDVPVDLSAFIGRSSGEIISELTGGANLVDGKQTWELADEFKDDLQAMLSCCQAELKTMEQAGQIPAPFYFERAAILFRKQKLYEKEVQIVELYLNAVDAWNAANGNCRPNGAGARHLKIKGRLAKAKQLASKKTALTGLAPSHKH